MTRMKNTWFSISRSEPEIVDVVANAVSSVASTQIPFVCAHCSDLPGESKPLNMDEMRIHLQAKFVTFLRPCIIGSDEL